MGFVADKNLKHQPGEGNQSDWGPKENREDAFISEVQNVLWAPKPYVEPNPQHIYPHEKEPFHPTPRPR